MYVYIYMHVVSSAGNNSTVSRSQKKIPNRGTGDDSELAPLCL